MNEVKIAPCPYCGKRPWENESKISHGHPGCFLNGVELPHAQWNALCADIDKGRDYDNLYAESLKTAKECGRVMIHLDTAVRLLDRYCNSTYAGDSSLSTLYRKTRDLLDTDWAKTILKQKGQ